MLAARTSTLGFFLFLLAWLAYDHYRPWVNFHSETLALCGLGLLSLGRCLEREASNLVAPQIVWVVLTVAFIPWAQYFSGFTPYAGDALVTCLYLCALSVGIWLGYEYSHEPTATDYSLTGVFLMLWLAAFISAAIGLYQWLNLQEHIGMYVLQTAFGDRAMGNLGQPNQLATLLLMGIVSLVWIFERKRVGHLGLIFGVTFLTVVLALSRSRAGLVSAFIVATFLLWKNWKRTTQLTSWHVIAWLSMYCGLLFITPQLQEFLMLGSSRGMAAAIDNERQIVWRQVISGISQAPWVGYGWNQTATAQIVGSMTVPGFQTFSYAHNIVLDLLAWNGVPLGLLLTGLGSWWFLSRIWCVSQRTSIYAMAALIPVLVHSMVEFPFAYSYFLLAAGLMVGIVEAFHRGVKAISLNINWARGGLAIWFVLGSYMIYEYLLIEEDFRVVRFENLRIGQTPAEYKVPNVWMLSQMEAMLNAYRQKPVRGMTTNDIEKLRQASLRFAQGSLALRYAVSLGLNGFPTEATHHFAIIRGMYGPVYYEAAVKSLRELQTEKYPELAQVITP